MSIRDSGVIDLFAIHKEEEARQSAVPSAPPPAVALDVRSGDDDDLESFAQQARSRARTKVIGGAIGAVAVVGLLVAAFTSSGKEEPKAAAAVAAPPPSPVATFVAPPPPAPDPAPVSSTPAPPSTGKPATEKPDYTRASAAAAYAASQGKGKKFQVGKKIAGNVKLTKVQSSGTN